jgi:putative MATE family efflux protein
LKALSTSTKPAQPRRKPFDRRIVEGPVGGAVWRLAWPAVLQNMLGGIQGMIDHAMVGHYVGYVGNAAIGVSWQIWVVIVVFIMSVFSGMGVLVARFTGADDSDAVNSTVYQAFLATAALSLLIMAPLGYVLAPTLLELVNAAPQVRAESLQYLRIMFVFSFGMMVFFMMGGAFRAAGDARTPLRLGILLTALNVFLNVILIRGVGPIPAFGTAGAAMGTVIAGSIVSVIAMWMLFAHRAVVTFHKAMDWRPDWHIIRELFRFGLPTGVQGIAMNIGGVFLLRFIGSLDRSAEAQAAYTVSYTQLFSFITWTSVGLMGAAAAVAGQNLGAGRPDRVIEGVRVASRIGLGMAAFMGVLFLAAPRALLAIFGMNEPAVVDMGVQLLAFLSLSGFFLTVALTHTGGLQGTGDTKGPLYISIISQLVLPLGICAVLQATRGLQPAEIWLAIVIGHFTRAALTVTRFRQGKWRHIEVNLSPRAAAKVKTG